MANNAAVPDSQKFMISISFLRSTMSAKAPAGSVKKKKGREATVDISDNKNADGLNIFIAQVAAVSWAETHVPERSVANQRLR
jgi:hypothetical protein